MRTMRYLASAALLLGLIACATTTFTSTWRAPEARGLSPMGKTIGAVFISRDEGMRRAAEDVLAADLTTHGAHGIAAYTVVPDTLRGNGEAARDKLRAAGADAAVVMRVVGKDQKVTYTPGMAVPVGYRGFGPYWGTGWGMAYEPGSLQTDTIVSVETLVYSLKSGALLWASTSRTTNPKNLNALVSEVARATAQEMVKQGFIAP